MLTEVAPKLPWQRNALQQTPLHTAVISRQSFHVVDKLLLAEDVAGIPPQEWLFDESTSRTGLIPPLPRMGEVLPGQTALHLVALHSRVQEDDEVDNNLAVLLTLIKTRPSWVLARDQQGRTPLHLAAAHNKTSIVTTLVTADPSAILIQDISGETPAHAAARNFRNETVLRYLLDKNPCIGSIEDRYGRTPLQLAALQFKSKDFLMGMRT